jgi:3-oxoadipate CoA-transferase alpha subunit
MATAARCTVAQVDELVPLGALDPEHVVTPGIFVHRLVAVGDTVTVGPAPVTGGRS